MGKKDEAELEQAIMRRAKSTWNDPAPVAVVPPAAPRKKAEKPSYLTSRQPPEAKDAAKRLAMDLGQSIEWVILEALNDFLRKHGRAPIPQPEGREK